MWIIMMIVAVAFEVGFSISFSSAFIISLKVQSNSFGVSVKRFALLFGFTNMIEK